MATSYICEVSLNIKKVEDGVVSDFQDTPSKTFQVPYYGMCAFQAVMTKVMAYFCSWGVARIVDSEEKKAYDAMVGGFKL